MKSVYKKAYIVECEVCHAITQIKRSSLFDPYTTDEYQTFDKNGNVVWIRIDNWYSSNIEKKWSIEDETVLCPECLKTIQLAKELQDLSHDEIERLRQEMRKV